MSYNTSLTFARCMSNLKKKTLWHRGFINKINKILSQRQEALTQHGTNMILFNFENVYRMVELIAFLWTTEKENNMLKGFEEVSKLSLKLISGRV